MRHRERTPGRRSRCCTFAERHRSTAHCQLGDLVECEPDNAAALVCRGTVHYHQIAGAIAAADYRGALGLEPDNAVIRANLERFLRDRSARPGVRLLVVFVVRLMSTAGADP